MELISDQLRGGLRTTCRAIGAYAQRGSEILRLLCAFSQSVQHNPDIILPESTNRHAAVSLQGGSSRPASLTSEVAEFDDDFTDLGEKMKNLSLEHDKALSERCFGPSSGLALFMSALSNKKKLTGSLNTMQLHDYSNLYPVCPAFPASQSFTNQ